MKSLLLMSILVMTFGVPMIVARDPDAGRGLRTMIFLFALFVALYYLYVAYGHTRYFIPQR